MGDNKRRDTTGVGVMEAVKINTKMSVKVR